VSRDRFGRSNSVTGQDLEEGENGVFRIAGRVQVHDSGLEPLIKCTRMLEDYWLEVMRWHHTRVSNGLVEGLNSLIQAAKRRARGYRTNRNYIAMVYLVAGKLHPGPAPRM
jgi:transposase